MSILLQTQKTSSISVVPPSDLENKKPIPEKFTELDRLAFVVRAIEFDCAVLPIGAAKLTPAHELRFDQSFRGLSIEEANSLQNWQHFREPQTEEKKLAIQNEDAIFHKNFLDGLAEDKPKGCWSVQSDDSKANVTVRNLLWPGFLAYHEARTGVFGYSYFGNGLKNVDLPFML
jgi:radial spoke head protein 9